jgi:hypothetical protein
VRIIEESRASKTGNISTCEDAFYVTEHYACVIDGATDVSGKRYDGQTAGQLISQVVAQTVPTLPPEADIAEIIGLINKALVRCYMELGILHSVQENPFSCPTAAMVIYSKSRRTVWMVGDCQCMIDGEEHTNPKQVDDIIANVRSLFLEAELQKGRTIEELLQKDTGFEAVRPFIQMQYYMHNLQEETQYSYVSVTGFEFNLDRIKSVRVKPDAQYLSLASDGYPCIFPTLEESERYLRHILDTDPLCFREYKLAKGFVQGNASFDDRTYLRVELD